MQFQFENLADFMSMSGHGPYVWFCYFVTFACLVYLIVAPLQRRRQLARRWRQQQRIAVGREHSYQAEQER